MSHFYFVTAQKSTRVGGSVVGKFLPEQETLIVWKSNRIEVFALSEEGIVAVTECKIYGHIEKAVLFRAPGEDHDRLFVLTREHHILTLNVSQNHVIEEVATGCIQDLAGEKAEPLVAMGEKMVALILYEGMLKVIPIDSKGLFSDAFNVRLPDRDVCSLTQLSGSSTIVYLCSDGDRRLLRSHNVSVKEKTLSEGPLSDVVDKGASHVVALGKGVLVAGELEAVWMSGKTRVTARFPGEQRSRLLSLGRVDPDGARWLLGDESGHLWLLTCTIAQGTVSRLLLQDMGVTVATSSISYLDNGVVFLGSAFGDPQVVRLLTEPDAENNFFEVVEVQANLAPVLDFVCVDLENRGQDQIVACCGALKDGSLRIIRNGIGVNAEADLPLPNITGVWSMRASSTAQFDKFLCVSFASQTIFLAMEEDDDLAELNDCGALVVDSRTLYAGTTIGELLVQVHGSGVLLVHASSLALCDKWQPPEGKQITVCCASGRQVVVAVGGTMLVLLRVEGMSLKQTNATTLQHEIACMDITPLVQGEEATLLAMGFWGEHSVSVLALSSLKVLFSEPLAAGSVVPRSVRLANLDGQARLLVGLGDGRLVHYRLLASNELVERKTVPLGTKAVILTPFVSATGAASLFVGSDRPAVMYSNNRKLLTSNVNQKNVSFVASFHTAQFPHCLAMTTGEALLVGRLQSLQKLHVDTVRLGGEMARRLAHHAPARAFAIGTTSGNVMGRDPAPVQAQIRLLDQVTMERLDLFVLERGEQLCSLFSLPLGLSGELLLIAGTAFVNVGDPEPMQGRLLVFQALRQKDDQQDVKLRLICARTVNGAVYALAPYPGNRLVVTINARVELLELTQAEASDSMSFVVLAEHFGHVLALHVKTRGEFILVGDLMRSMMVLRFDEGGSKRLVLAARDTSARWLMAVESLGDNFVGADQDGNLVVMARAEDDDQHLRTVARIHVGEGINCLRPGRLVQPDPSLDQPPPVPLVLGGTSGLLAVLQPIPEAEYLSFKKLEEALAAPLVWGLSHADWRATRQQNRRGVFHKHEGIVDGDLIESFLDLNPAEQSKVASAVSVPVIELVSRIEAMARQCH